MSQFTKRYSEKFGKRLIGRADMEDALKKLDKLTQEEVRMATAEVLRVTHAVDDKVAEVINGAQIVFSQARKILNLKLSDGKKAKQTIEQTAKHVDQVKRS
jgi:hypothetical protein